MDFRKLLGSYIGSNAPLIQVVSHEWEVLEGHISASIQDIGDKREHLKWSNNIGMQLFEAAKSVTPSDDQKAEFAKMHNLTDVLKWFIGDPSSIESSGYQKSSILHIEDAQLFIDPDDLNADIISWLRQACRMPLSENANDGINRSIILTTTKATYVQELDKEMVVLDMPLPSSQNLAVVMQHCIDKANKSGLEIAIENEQERRELINSTMGLTVMEANIAYNKAIYVHKTLGIEQIPFILNEKKRIIKRTGTLEFIEPGKQEIGGLRKLTNWLKIRKEAFSPKAMNYGLEYPRGILLLGFPGCGKSLTAIHTAKTWNYPLLRFDIGSVYGSLIGETENNMRQALKVAEAISPCILWIDEIEKGLSGNNSLTEDDGGTSARILGTLLTWMQEKTTPVFVLATANNIDSLPAELLRKGRFDEIFFVDLPNQASREAIFDIHIKNKSENSREHISKFDINKLAKISNGMTGAEIKQAVIEGMHVSFSAARLLNEEDIINALKLTYPMYMTMFQRIEGMRMRKGKMYKSAEEGDSEPLPKVKAGEIPLTKRERAHNNPFLPDLE